MSILVVGISHKSAPVAVLERVALDRDGVNKLLEDVVYRVRTLELPERTGQADTPALTPDRRDRWER